VEMNLWYLFKIFLLLNGLNEILIEELKSEGKACKISASIGAAVYPKTAALYENMFEKADKELYKVKRSGRNGNSIFIYKEKEKQEII